MSIERLRGERQEEQQVLQAAAVVAVGAAAVAFVAGIGTYLYIRFTQHRLPPPGERKGPAAGATTRTPEE
jgi:hypothetical protein